MIRKFGATGIDIQPQGLDLGIGGGSNIKSIQRGEINMANKTSIDITISSVDLTKAICRISHLIQMDSIKIFLAGAYLKNATTLTIEKQDYTALTDTLEWEVIEFNNVKSIQKGTSANGSIAISTVNTTKSLIIPAGCKASTTAQPTQSESRYKFESNTSINIYQQYVDLNYWQVIEFN